MIHRDTVASVGVIMGRSLPFVDVNTTIRVFRQALSLDEVRDRRHMICYSLADFSLIASHQVPSQLVS